MCHQDRPIYMLTEKIAGCLNYITQPDMVDRVITSVIEAALGHMCVIYQAISDVTH